MVQISGPRFYRLSFAISLLLVLVAFSSLWHNGVTLRTFRSALDHQFCRAAPEHDNANISVSVPQVRRNVVLATRFGFHQDVMFALAWTIERVMGGNGKFTVYAPSPLSWNFGDVVKALGLYHGEVKMYQNLIKDILASSGDGGIDMVILGTCEIDLRDWGEEILAAWDARDEEHKFQLVCVVHDVKDTWWQRPIPDWSRRNAVRLLPISEHVAKAFRESYRALASSPDPYIYSAGYEHIPIDVHAHILDIPNLPDLPPTRMLSNAVIQGFFDVARRDYERIFRELTQYLHEDPRPWGYLPLGHNGSFTRDQSLSDPPFCLHLAGTGELNIPPELKEVVVIHKELDYNQYYTLLGRMDICIPAFAATDARYFLYQASSTVGMCLEVDTPLLATQRMRDTYQSIDDDRVVITRPAVITEVSAIKALRTGNASAFLASDPVQSGRTMGSHPHIRRAVEKMMAEGWIRPKEGFDAVKRKIWSQNDAVVWRLLRDL